ncbi:MAG: radical SAM protein [Candidatus Omnitrophica bacterium]|nr:radical SAM protein [Candidatus Omnitrophota bacterium]
MAKVLLLSPLYLDLYGNLQKAAGRYFPLGLGYIASYLRKYGNHEVRMYEPEAQRLSHEDIARIIKTFAPEVIGLTCTTPNFARAIKMAGICKINSGAKVVLGGVHASAIPEFIMQKYPDLIDCVVAGEGEITMLELVNAYQSGSGIETIKGIVYAKDGEVIRNEIRPFIENPDSIPFPSRDLIPQALFAPNMHNARYRNCATILTSRGCPFNCSFCASRLVSGRKYRTHSAEYVLAEMSLLKQDYHIRQLVITDDTFTLDQNRLETICRGMIDRKMRLAWFCFGQAGTVDRELLKLMKKAGCYSIGFGVESSDEATLKKMGKNILPAKAKETIKIAQGLGLKTQAFYIIGSPGETREQMNSTVKFSREVGSTLAFYNMLVPFPGTREFDYFFSGIPLEEIDWEKFVAIGEHCVVKNASVSAKEIERIIGGANISYYAHPKRLFNIAFHIRTFYELGNYLRGGSALLKQTGKWFK